MARTARTWEPGGILHVASRAFEGGHIFATDEAREFVVASAARVFARTRTRCLAWAVLSNHYHLLLQCGTSPPGVVMHMLNTRIARRARDVRGERGPIFQDRYFSRVCTDDTSQVEMLTYVLGNPLRHGVVPSVEALERHPWSGLGEVLGTVRPRLVDVACVLEYFHERPDVARASVRNLLQGRADRWAGRGDELDGAEGSDVLPVPRRVGTDESMRPGLRAVMGIVDPVVGDWESRAARRLLLMRTGWTADALLAVVCRRIGSDPSAVRHGRRAAVDASARAALAFLACDYAGVPASEIARLTSVATSSIARARARGRQLVEKLNWDPASILDESRTRRSDHDPVRR